MQVASEQLQYAILEKHKLVQTASTFLCIAGVFVGGLVRGGEGLQAEATFIKNKHKYSYLKKPGRKLIVIS